MFAMLSLSLLLLSSAVFHAGHAVPFRLDTANQVVIRKVIAVESIIVDGQGNRVRVTQDVVDVEALQAAKNNMTAALIASKALAQFDDSQPPAIVPMELVGEIPKSSSPASMAALQYARVYGLRQFAEVGGENIKSDSQLFPFSQYSRVDLKKLSEAPVVDYLKIDRSTDNKMEVVLAAIHGFSQRGLLQISGCAHSTECKSVEGLLKAAGWQKVYEDKDDLVIARKNPAETKSLLEQTLDSIFDGLMSPAGHRYKTMRRAAELAILRGARVIVETGTARNGAANCGGDGCSTIIFGRLVELVASISALNAPLLYTVDILPQAIREARQAASKVSSRISYHAIDSLQFLDAFAQPIDLLYLDSYDFNSGNPQPSQRHHLKELLVAWDKLHDKSVIMVDDCGLSNMGKCKLVDEHLMYAGWRLDTDGYQRVYVKS